MRSCLPQGNLSVEEEFEIFGEQDKQFSQPEMMLQYTVIVVSSSVASKGINISPLKPEQVFTENVPFIVSDKKFLF